MKPITALATGLAACLLLGGCVAPVGPVQVTCFHDPARLDALAQGTIAVEAAPGEDPDSLELRSYRLAVAHELQRIGYQPVLTGSGGQVAEVRVERRATQPASRSPVSVGVGGSAGSHGSGLGVGLGFDLTGNSGERIDTTLGVVIRDRGSGEVVWEGRASFTVSASSPLASTQLGAPRLAEALFRNFPGNNGETIEIP